MEYFEDTRGVVELNILIHTTLFDIHHFWSTKKKIRLGKFYILKKIRSNQPVVLPKINRFNHSKKMTLAELKWNKQDQ